MQMYKMNEKNAFVALVFMVLFRNHWLLIGHLELFLCNSNSSDHETTSFDFETQP